MHFYGIKSVTIVFVNNSYVHSCTCTSMNIVLLENSSLLLLSAFHVLNSLFYLLEELCDGMYKM